MTEGYSVLNQSCIKAGYRDLKKAIANDLFYSWPAIYAHNAPDINQFEFPTLWEVLRGKHHVDKEGTTNVQEIGPGKKFIVFSKTGYFNQDIYKRLMAPELAKMAGIRRLTMYVESWLSGSGRRLQSDCTGNSWVYNVKELMIGTRKKYHYKTTKDHSKWAITNTGHVCVGGMNRMRSQMRRGGSTVCLQAASLVAQMKYSIYKYDSCRENEEIDSMNQEEWQKSAARAKVNAQEIGFKFALLVLCALFLKT